MPSIFFRQFRPSDRIFKFFSAFSPVTLSMLLEESPRCSTLASCERRSAQCYERAPMG